MGGIVGWRERRLVLFWLRIEIVRAVILRRGKSRARAWRKGEMGRWSLVVMVVV